MACSLTYSIRYSLPREKYLTIEVLYRELSHESNLQLECHCQGRPKMRVPLSHSEIVVCYHPRSSSKSSFVVLAVNQLEDEVLVFGTSLKSTVIRKALQIS